MSDPTQVTPAAQGPPPGGDGPDWRVVTVGVLAALIVVLAVILLLVGGDDDGDVASDDRSPTTTSTTSASETSLTSSTTTSSSTTSTTEATTTTTAEPTTTTPSTTTTTSPPPTIAPHRCTGRRPPNEPEPVAQVFYDAWTIDDRACAEQVASGDAVDDLFVFDGSHAAWRFEGCVADEEAVEPHTDCLYRYEGGSAAFEMRFGAIDGWQIVAVTFTAD